VAAERTDSELVHEARAGDTRAFSRLLVRHQARAVLVARRMLGDAHEAEDVAQEAALSAYLDLGRLERPERFGAWLCGIAVNLAKMRLRRRRREASPTAADGAMEVEPTGQLRLEAAEQLSRVHSAVALLPQGQRELVLLYYLDGLSSQEIAALLGRSPGAVRVGLHRARAQLRSQLHPLAPSSAKEPEMVEVTVEDVVVRLVDEHLAADHRIVVLRERGGERALPIWVGPPEGDSLALHLGGEGTPRPLTADLMARLVEAAGARVERVTISSLLEKTFYAVVTVSGSGGPADVDARPSDALNLALRVGAPIFVDREVLEAGAIPASDVHGGLDREREKHGEPELEGAWESLSPELVRTVGMWRR
jgi:RNA polymerase sigma factor (sigma-70 family)